MPHEDIGPSSRALPLPASRAVKALAAITVLLMALVGIPAATASTVTSRATTTVEPGGWAGFGSCFLLVGDPRYVYLERKSGSSWRFVERYSVYRSDCAPSKNVGGYTYYAYSTSSSVGMNLLKKGTYTLRVRKCNWDGGCGVTSAGVASTVAQKKFVVKKSGGSSSSGLKAMSKKVYAKVIKDTGVAPTCWKAGDVSRTDSRWASVWMSDSCGSSPRFMIVQKTSQGWTSALSNATNVSCSSLARWMADALPAMPERVVRNFTGDGAYCN